MEVVETDIVVVGGGGAGMVEIHDAPEGVGPP